MDTSGLTVAGHIGTWHTIDQHEVGGHSFYLMEHDTYGDEAACIIVDERGKLVLDDVYNGFDDDTLRLLDLEVKEVPEMPDPALTVQDMKDYGYEVAAAVAADGISGVHTEGIMNFLLNEAKRQGIGTILARDTSRISRDTSSFMSFERKFRENGIRFEYLSKPDNELPVTPMMEAFAAAYKKRRTKNGTRA